MFQATPPPPPPCGADRPVVVVAEYQRPDCNPGRYEDRGTRHTRLDVRLTLNHGTPTVQVLLRHTRECNDAGGELILQRHERNQWTATCEGVDY